MNILVTGGAGYIGSHTCIALLELGHSVIIVDNFINSNVIMVDKIEKISSKSTIFYEGDLTNENVLKRVFEENKIDGVIHFASLKSVKESIENPLLYYTNNLNSTLILTKLCLEYNVKKFIFSSSATVYGDNKSPLFELMNLKPTTNPYGETKAMCERILKDVAKANPDFCVTILRYFNPIGAHESGLIGEAPNNIPNNLMPYLTQVASKKLQKLSVFGNDYNTLDGTGVRDYIHVMDLAEGHVAALEKLSSGVKVYNLGTGKGTTVLQLINAFEVANDITIPYKIVGRRNGDVASCFADTSKANKELGWIAKRNIVDMCKDAWRFEKNNQLSNFKTPNKDI